MVKRDENHVYRNEKGLIYLSNTQHLVIAGWSDLSMVNGEDLEYAQERGTHVHNALNMFVEDDLDLGALENEPYKGYVDAGIAFLKATGFVPYNTNVIVFNDLLRTAGEIDMVGRLANSKQEVILDWKTGAPSAVTAIQLSGYNSMYISGKLPCERILLEANLKDNGGYTTIAHDRKKNQSTFEQIARVNWKALSMGVIPVGAKNDPQIYELCKTIIREG